MNLNEMLSLEQWHSTLQMFHFVILAYMEVMFVSNILLFLKTPCSFFNIVWYSCKTQLFTCGEEHKLQLWVISGTCAKLGNTSDYGK